ncbi:MAG: ABC transporter substrate-binding protein [Bacilli bacterium]|nr:ABC transporter substrate-binding protein [Bacilli bacterium]
MKKTKLLTLLSASLMMVTLSGCDNTYKIGILLPVEHAALQSCTDGFLAGLKEAGLIEGKDFKTVIRNAGGKDSDLVNYAKDLVSSTNMTFGLGTGASQMLKSAAKDKGSINPILFSAVTDPVDATLVESLENGKGFVTGASDAQPINDQIQMIKLINPSADKIGVIYTQTEENSKVQAEQVKSAATSLGMSTEIMTVTGPSDISAVALSLASVEGIDAIYVPTDNNVAANMNAVLQSANSKNILVVAAEEGSLTSGGHISFSFSYNDLGKATGKMAAQIIKGEKTAAQLPIKLMGKEDCKYMYSSANLVGTSIVLPESFTSNAVDVSK